MNENDAGASMETFSLSAVEAIQKALGHARNGDGQALQATLNEIALYYYQNYTDSTQPDADAADALNKVDLSTIVTVESISDEEIWQFLESVLSVSMPEGESEGEEGMNEKAQETTGEEVETETVETTEQVEVEEGAESTAEAEQATEQAEERIQFFNFGEEMAGIKNQTHENSEMLKQVLAEFKELKRAFVVTAPEANSAEEVAPVTTGQKTSTKTVHRLKFGGRQNGKNNVDEDAVARMTKNFNIGGK